MKNISFKLLLALVATCLIATTSCKKYLDINTDPDTPQNPDPSSVMPAMLSALARGVQFDARYLGAYTQMFQLSAPGYVWDAHGYAINSDAGGELFRQAYFGLGRNLEYMISEGNKHRQWDYVGAAQALKCHTFQQLTLTHGEVGWDSLYNDNQFFYSYQSQPYVLSQIDSLCRISLNNLSRTDFDLTYPRLAKGDYVYGGNTALWRKFVNGILARNFLCQMHKNPTFPDSVIKYSALAMATTAEDFVIPFDASRNDDANFFGTFRNNWTNLRQSRFIVNLLDGTTLNATVPTTINVANRDPRMQHMLTVGQDTVTLTLNGGYRGLAPVIGDPNTATVNPRQRVPTLWGDSLLLNPGSGNFGLPQGKFLFHNKAALPIMTFSEMQFIQAEAQFAKAPNSVLAYNAYRTAIGAHFDMINRASYPRANNPLFKIIPITFAERTAYLAGPAVKQSPVALTRTDIMLQKYIALWGWGYVETWTDQRRYHYKTDLDPQTALPVYNSLINFTIFADNQNRNVNRLRPRFNSEYVWNIDAINNMIAFSNTYNTFPISEINFHTAECWFSRP